MSNSTCDIGDVIRITGTFAQAGSALDPTTVSLQVRTPDGTITTYVYPTDSALVRTATGAYRLDYAITLAGQHWYRWVTTGTGAAAEENWFVVRPKQVS
jgi:hypothetical protein